LIVAASVGAAGEEEVADAAGEVSGGGPAAEDLDGGFELLEGDLDVVVEIGSVGLEAEEAGADGITVFEGAASHDADEVVGELDVEPVGLEESPGERGGGGEGGGLVLVHFGGVGRAGEGANVRTLGKN